MTKWPSSIYGLKKKTWSVHNCNDVEQIDRFVRLKSRLRGIRSKNLHSAKAECHPSEKFAKNQGKERENQEKVGKKRGNWEKEEKLGKGKKQESSFTLPLLTDRAGYATEVRVVAMQVGTGRRARQHPARGLTGTRGFLGHIAGHRNFKIVFWP